MGQRRKSLMLGSLILLTLLIASCAKEPLKIGFIGSLTTKNSQLSIDARNAVLLGVDQINENGGIDGHKIELVIKDDGAETEIAKQKHDEFKSEKIQLVIGHMTSNMSEAALSSQGEDLLFLSPSMGASSLTGIDDYFLSTSPLTDNQALTFLKLADDLAVMDAIILYDMMNAEYTENMAKHAVLLNKKMSKLNLTLIPFDSRTDDLEAVAEQALDYTGTELILMISQAMDTAVLTQTLKNSKPDLKLASVSWSMTEDLIINGGSAVEGMYFIGVYKSEVPSDRYVQFEKAFFEKYQYEPTFISVLAYDAFQVMVEAIKKSKEISPESIKAEIINLGTINGLEETFEMNQFGDNNRGYLIYQLNANKFVPLYN